MLNKCSVCKQLLIQNNCMICFIYISVRHSRLSSCLMPLIIVQVEVNSMNLWVGCPLCGTKQVVDVFGYRLWIEVRRVPLDQLSFLVNKELLEVPGDVGLFDWRPISSTG